MTCLRCGSPTYSVCRYCHDTCCGLCLYKHEAAEHPDEEAAARQATAERERLLRLALPPEPLPWRSARAALGIPDVLPQDDEVHNRIAHLEEQERQNGYNRAYYERQRRERWPASIAGNMPLDEDVDTARQVVENVAERSYTPPEPPLVPEPEPAGDSYEPISEKSDTHVHRWVIGYEAGTQVGRCECGEHRRYENPNAPRQFGGKR